MISLFNPMKATNRRATYTTWAAFMMLGMAIAQHPTDYRKKTSLRHHYAIQGIESGILEAASEQATLKWEIVDTSIVLADSYDLPGTLHGDIQELGSKRFLVSGSSAGATGKGYLLVIELENTPEKAITNVLGPVDLGISVDAHDAAWNSQDKYLYVLDNKGKRILAAQWQGYPAALPTQFSTAADINSVEDLKQPDTLRLFVPTNRDGVMVGADRYSNYVTRATPRVYPELGQWKVEIHKVDPFAAPFSISSRIHTNSRGPLYFAGGGGPVQISDSTTGALVVELQLPGSGLEFTAVQLPDPNLLIPGLSYTIKWRDQTDGGQFRPMVRYGVPQSTGDIYLGRGFANPSRAFLDSSSFAVAGPLQMDPVPTGTFSQVVQAQLFVAARLPNGSDPVQIVGEAAILQPVNVFGPWGHTLNEKHPALDLGELQAIANDPNLAGAVILWQWVISWGENSVSYSDVFGTTVFASEGESSGQSRTAAMSARIAASSKGNKVVLKKVVVDAAWKWLGAPTGKVPAKKLQRATQLLQLMKRQALLKSKMK